MSGCGMRPRVGGGTLAFGEKLIEQFEEHLAVAGVLAVEFSERSPRFSGAPALFCRR